MPEQNEEAIRQRAHGLWEKAGCPEAEADRFWLEAERELQAEKAAPPEARGKPDAQARGERIDSAAEGDAAPVEKQRRSNKTRK